MSKIFYGKCEDVPIPNHVEEIVAILRNSSNKNHNYPDYQKDLKEYLKDRDEYSKRFF